MSLTKNYPENDEFTECDCDSEYGCTCAEVPDPTCDESPCVCGSGCDTKVNVELEPRGATPEQTEVII